MAILALATVGFSQVVAPKPGDVQGDCIYWCKQGLKYYVHPDGTTYETSETICIEMFKFQNGTTVCPQSALSPPALRAQPALGKCQR